MKQHKFKETYEFVHNGIIVYVKIDYINNKISLVDPWRLDEGKFQGKVWMFKDRGVEFMGCWLKILEAITLAVKDAKLKYEQNLAEESKFKEDKIIKHIKNAKRSAK